MDKYICINSVDDLFIPGNIYSGKHVEYYRYGTLGELKYKSPAIEIISNSGDLIYFRLHKEERAYVTLPLFEDYFILLREYRNQKIKNILE